MTLENSAWYYNWSKFSENGRILWANPPFDDLEKVLTKVCLEPCRMVLVTPNWQKGTWRSILEEITIYRQIVPANVPVYESQVSTWLLPGRSWETIVTYMDTR